MSLKDTLNRLIELAEPEVKEVGEHTYCRTPLHLIVPPQTETVKVTTLTGFAEAAERLAVTDLEAGCVLAHVRSPVHVVAIPSGPDDVGRYANYVSATADCYGHPFGQFLPPELFVIWLQSQFTATKPREELLAFVSSIKSANETVSADDGISQQVSVRTGVALTERKKVQRIFRLAPYRTFVEIEQPESDFLLRVKSGDDGVTIALFEADGGRWRNEAMMGVVAWLAKGLKAVPVIA